MLAMRPRSTRGFSNHERPFCSIRNMHWRVEPTLRHTRRMTSHSHVHTKAWQDGPIVLSRRKNCFQDPSNTAHLPASMRAYHIHSQPCNARVDNQQVQVRVRCRTRVRRVGRTINRRLTVPTVSQRGSYSRHAQTSILGPWRTLPTAHHPFLGPSLDISYMDAALSVSTC